MTVAIDRPNPQKRNLLIRRLARLPWWLLLIALFIIYVYLSVQDNPRYELIWTGGMLGGVQAGIKTTLWVTGVAFTIAMLMGLMIALLRRSANPVVYHLTTAYVEFIRGIPTLILVYFIVLAGVPKLLGYLNDLGEWMIREDINLYLGFSVRNMLAHVKTRDIDDSYKAIAALAISYSAFLSEIFRAGIDSVDKGQIEAAKSLGMNRRQVTFLIVLPQAFRTVLPPLGNDFIAMLKESSLVSVVGVEEITRAGNKLAASRYLFFEAYTVIALTYLVLTLSLSVLVRLLEMALNRHKVRD
jgi:polar amino acid transport system permease protein